MIELETAEDALALCGRTFHNWGRNSCRTVTDVQITYRNPLRGLVFYNDAVGRVRKINFENMRKWLVDAQDSEPRVRKRMKQIRTEERHELPRPVMVSAERYTFSGLDGFYRMVRDCTVKQGEKLIKSGRRDIVIALVAWRGDIWRRRVFQRIYEDGYEYEDYYE